MAKFEVHIPAANPTSINVTLRVDAEHWMAALRTGMLKLGEQGSSVQNVLVDVQADGSVHVTESRSGRVFQIREIAEDKPPRREAPDTAASTMGLPSVGQRGSPDEHPTLLDLPAVPPPLRSEKRVSSSSAPMPKGVAMTKAAEPASPKGPALSVSDGSPTKSAETRRETDGWPWAASLSAHGQVEGASRPSASAAPPAPRTPTPAPHLRAASVVEVAQPSRAVAGRIGRALQNKKDRRQEIDDALAEIFERVQDLYSQASEEASLYLLLDLALEKIPAESGSVLLSDAGTGGLAFAAARGPKAPELLKSGTLIPSGVGIAGFCAVEGVSVALSDVQRDARWYREVSARLNYPTKSVLCAPMMTHGRAFGCMQLINRAGSDTFSDHEIGMLAYLAHQGALYLNSRS